MKDSLLVEFAATAMRLAELTRQVYDRENGRWSTFEEMKLIGARLTLLESMMLDLDNAQQMVRDWK